MELPLLLALASALTWGAGDFFGGLATRQAKAVSTTFVSQFVGLVGLVVVCLLGAGGSFVPSDLGWGVAAGLCAVSGLGLFYESMGRGPFGPVASITSVMSGAIPIVAGLALGERPSTFLLGGVVVAVVAIWLIAGEKRKESDPENSAVANLFALGAGVLFGLYFVFLSRAGNASGLWPLAAGRLAATVSLGITIAVMRRSKSKTDWIPKRQALRLSASAGLLDASANALYFYASRNGLLSVVAVLASLYPVSTIGLARLVLREKLNPRRLVGMVVGLFAVSIIAKGSVAPRSGSDITVHAQPAPLFTPAVNPTQPGAKAPSTTSSTSLTSPTLRASRTSGASGGQGVSSTTTLQNESSSDVTPISTPITVAPRSLPENTVDPTANSFNSDPEALALVEDQLFFAAPFPVDSAQPNESTPSPAVLSVTREDPFFEEPWKSSPTEIFP
jgi:drug/metabolite transporter (DMT)-like permease